MAINFGNKNGSKFRCRIKGVLVSGVISIESNNVYLCQNERDGAHCDNKRGYRYSWCCNANDKFDDSEFATAGITEFEFIDSFSLTDFKKRLHIGTLLIKERITYRVIFVSNELVVLRKGISASSNFTVEELYNNHFEIIEEPKNIIIDD